MANTARSIAVGALTLLLWVGVSHASDLRSQLSGLNPRTYEGAEKIVQTVHEALFRGNGKGLGAAKVRCQGVLASVKPVAKKLPFRIRVMAAEALAECQFVNGQRENARRGLETLLTSCQKGGCPLVLETSYGLARRWLWPGALKPWIDAEAKDDGALGAVAKGKGYAGLVAGVGKRLDKLSKLIAKASRSIETRRSKGGFLVEQVHAGGGAEYAGVHSGDIIISVSGRTLRHMADYKRSGSASGRVQRAGGSGPRVESIYFLRGGLGHERALGKRAIGADVIEVRPRSAPGH